MSDLAAVSARPASAIGRALAAGDVSPIALAELFLARIEAQTSPVFLHVTAERALSEAKASEARLKAGRALSPLDGVPIGWKDLIDIEGTPTTAGAALLRDAVPAKRDAPVVVHAAAAGMVTLGKLNLTEFAYSGLGLNPTFGTPINPHGAGAARAPGGSSSGSGVAVAAGLAPCAIGTDTGGSVRIPAAFNGVVGYKSSTGRIDKAGVFALSPTLDTLGPLARSVEDCVLLDMVLRGAVTTPVRRRSLEGLRIHVAEGVPLADLDEAVSINFEASMARLERAGVQITRGPVQPFDDAVRLLEEFGSIAAAEAYVEHRARVNGPDEARMDRRVVARILGGKRMSAADLIGLMRGREAGMRALAEVLDGALLAMPTTPIVAPEIAPLEADDAVFHATNLKTLRNTAIGNFLDTPGLAIPNGTDAEGLPTSFLLSAPSGEDERLLSAGLAVEALVRADMPHGDT